MHSEDLIEFYNRLDKIDGELVGYHNYLIGFGLRETSVEYHVEQALSHVFRALEDLDRRIKFAREDENEREGSK